MIGAIDARARDGATSITFNERYIIMKKSIETLIPDIHNLLIEGKKQGVDEKHLKEFFNALENF